MNKLFRYAAILGMTVCACTGLRAAEQENGGFQATLNWIVGTGKDMKAIKDGPGYTVGIGYKMPISSAYSLRFHINAMSFDGVVGSGITKSRPAFFGGLDAQVPVTSHLSVYGGVIALSWNQQMSGSVTNPNFQNRYDSVGTKISSRLAGTKAGIRLGLEYRIVDHLSANVGWTVSQANLAYNPSWLNVGVVYSF